MSKYLNPNTVLERLKEEYLTHGRLIVAFDFDGTVCDYDHDNPEPTSLRKPCEKICKLLRRASIDCHLVLWTCRSEEKLFEAIDWLAKHKIPCNRVNKNPFVDFGGPKLYANLFLDDRAGLAESVTALEKFLDWRDENRFDAKKYKQEICLWIKQYFKENASPDTKAIIGISGGIDSAVCAALCSLALGQNRVLGIRMPDGIQKDSADATAIIDYLGIDSEVYNIRHVLEPLYTSFQTTRSNRSGIIQPLCDTVLFNTPARIRMTVLYMFAAQLDGRVVNTCNLSETFVGYDTKWGDNAGDFAPIADLTKTEVRALARELGIPDYLIEKASDDGMCGTSDEERWGFTYQELDRYVRGVAIGENVDKILSMYAASAHKRAPIPRYVFRG